ncbi:MAG: aldehyde dehydrogenase family protein [Candidatus Aenigmarchaeota archaeon]|nr:aldehyde dehydrogenase family protein [Candidatus Aenigmarchaeota archaeon]
MNVHKILINGEWVESNSGETFESINPATEQLLGKFQKGNREDVKKAIDSAEDAFEKWSSYPAPKRGEILLKAYQLLKQNKQRLGELVTKEMGKVLPEGLGDVQEAIDITAYMAGEGRRLFGHTTPSELPDKFCMTVRRPIGVVGLISPWNFPVAIPSWKIMPALICGNTVVFKPASDTPLCAIEFVKILEQAGIPDGVINLVTGPGSTVGDEMVTNPKIRGLSFTGSREVGLEVTKKAGLKKVGVELGGKNGIIIMDDANLSLALDGVIWGGFGTTGQRCTAASRVIVHEKVKDKFLDMFLERTEKLKLGDGLKKNTDVGPLINERAREKVDKYTQIGINEGARLLFGGRRVGGKGFFYQPTIFTDVTIDMRIAQEEIFGPTVSVIEVKDFNEAIEAMNSVKYGLSSSIYTQDINKAFKAIEKIEAGITYVNASTIGSEVHLPFGGVKDTGNGTREAGIEGIHEFSETKTVYVDYSGKLQRAQIDIE